MGEYATRRSDGAEIKIGTCESMYYLRADQVADVRAQSGNVDPMRDARAIRFRFPFPDEDHVLAGAFEDCDRGVMVPGLQLLGLEHGTVFLEHGKNAERVAAVLPCPFAGDGKPAEPWATFMQSKRAPYSIVAQGVRGAGVLATVVRCEVCDSMWSLLDLTEVSPVLEALQRLALESAKAQERYDASPETCQRPRVAASFWTAILERATRGYTNPPAWVTS